MIRQPHQAEFLMYDVREDLAEEFKCANSSDEEESSAKAMQSKEFGKYVGAVFNIKVKDQRGRLIAMLWQKDRSYWRMIAYKVDPEVDRSTVPNVGTRATAPPLETVEGDKDMTKAATDFLKLWLLNKDVEKAVARYVAPDALACVNLNRAEDAPPVATAAEARMLLIAGMNRTAAAVGAVKQLNNAIVAPQPFLEGIKLVKHGEARAFALVSIPEPMGDAANCAGRQPGEDRYVPIAATGYGKYYVTGLSFNFGREGPAVLWILWKKADNAWKVSSFEVLAP